MDWKRYITDFVGFLKIEKGLSENSVMAYQNDVNKLADFSVGINKDPMQLTHQDLVQFVTVLYDLGLSPRSQARVISGVKQFFGYLVLEEDLINDPSELIEMPSIGRKLPEVLSVEEIDHMMKVIDLDKFEGQRNRAILETLYSCGLRVSELINLKYEDLHFDEGYMRVIGKGNKQRLVPVNSIVEHEINLYHEVMRNQLHPLQKHEKFVFLNRRGAPLTRVMIFTIVRQLAEAAGIKRPISPHTFRHSFATHLLEGGANLRAIQEMLGHESITTTEIYTHLDDQFLRDAILKFHPRNMR